MAISSYLPYEFSVSIVPDRDEITVVPAGDIDVASVEHLEHEVEELRGAGFTDIIIDLRQVAFIDSRGLEVLLLLRSAALCDGQTLKLVPGSEDVQRLFTLTATRGLFEWV
jgi:anti-anti-sigma factor